eukprot:366442-Chlamydomonas_euryale.AAC.11
MAARGRGARVHRSRYRASRTRSPHVWAARCDSCSVKPRRCDATSLSLSLSPPLSLLSAPVDANVPENLKTCDQRPALDIFR